jgi:transcriptional antiterminator Rof (Rho-off)
VAPGAGPEIRASAVTIALPDHEPAVSYRDGKRYWGELKHGLVPEGSGLLAYPDGTVYDGEFVGGVFEGTGTLAYPDGTTFQGRFSQGLPTDDGDLTVDPRRLAENDDRAKELLRELKTARDELSRAAASEASSADLEAIMARIRQTETSLRELVDVEALLSRIGIDSDISLSLEDGLDARFHLSSETETRTVADTFEETTRTDTDLVVEDREVAVQRTEETTTTSSDGEVVQVETSTTEAKADTDFVGVEHREELRERRYEPVTSLAFGTWNLDYTGSSVMGYSSHNILALLGYRSVSRSTPFPGAEGGSKPGFDFRLSAGAGLGIFGGEAMASLSGWGSIGYSKVTFEPLNQNDLTQKGKGFSIGLQLGGTIIPAQGIFEPIVAPLFTIDRYTYNPSTAMYRASFYRLFIWPVPFMLYLGIGGSF